MSKVWIMFVLVSLFAVSKEIDFDALEKKSSNNHSVSMDFNDANHANDKQFQKINNGQRKAIKKFMTSIAASRGNYVMVNFDTTCGLLMTCTDHKLNITGSPGIFHASAGGSGAIHKNGSRGLVGSYQYSGTFKRNGNLQICSGSFNLSGTKQNYMINVYNDCRDAGSREY